MSKHKIVVIEGSWVLTGECTNVGDDIVITNASCIRRWGTTMGLGQLALKGTTSDTVLDLIGTAEVPRRSVLFSIICKKELST